MSSKSDFSRLATWSKSSCTSSGLCARARERFWRATVRSQQIAAIAGPCDSAKLFRDRHSKSFRAYLQDLRMEVAADLPARTSLPVAQIARRVGYRDASRFGQHFKRAHALTPSQWRNRGSSRP